MSSHIKLVKLAALTVFVLVVAAVLLTGDRFGRRVHAFSAGPPAGFTAAPGEFDCRECHLPDGAPSGAIQIVAPQTYSPGQTYQITVNLINTHPSRQRWGFQLTAVDDTGNRAGTLAAGATTQVIPGSLGTPARQYVEHTSDGTFVGQSNGASWTFSWTAPSEVVGPVLFYAAGNQANNDGNSSGDSINFTFASVQPADQPADFGVVVTPSTQVALPGTSAAYTVTVTPQNGFTGTVSLSATGLPPGASANFNPASVNLTDASPKTSTLTLTNGAAAPLGSFNFTVTGTSGSLARSGTATLVTGPTVLDPGVSVRLFASGFDQPVAMAFLGGTDFFFLIEKATGRVKLVTFDGSGVSATTVLDLAVNSASERGLLGITTHPRFPADPRVYLYWTESSTGADTADTNEVPLLGNRVDSFTWDGSSLTFERNLIRLRALQQDAGQPPRGNHNGGVLRFGPDGKLYVVIGDEGRRGQLQNLRFGPSASPNGPTVADDQFGGPEPDDEHLTGVVLRLNDDGTTPADNPFFDAQTGLAGEAAANVRKVFAYGVRNSFGMDFDPVTGQLWTQENGDDAFDEINRVTPGMNGGWIQLMGPSSRVAEFKQIEVARPGGLQQNRWPPERIADTPAEALARLFVLPGSHYREPEFSWKFAIAPAAIGFVRGTGPNAPGPTLKHRLLVGASRTTLHGGYLFRMALDAPRRGVLSLSPETDDKVADNADKFDAGESEQFEFGRDFGVVTDIRNASSGGVHVVSLSHGAVYVLGPRANDVRFAPDAFQYGEGAGAAVITVERSGDISGAVTVDYETVDSSAAVRCDAPSTQAFARCDYASTRGTLNFAPGQRQASFNVPLIDDGHVEQTETLSLLLRNVSGALPSPGIIATLTITDNDASPHNPIYTHPFFVRQHYLDFLSREPDEAGFNAWLAVLNDCPNAENFDAENESAECDRVAVSSGFFRSPEFTLKGYYVLRLYLATLGRLPTYNEVVTDMARVTGTTAADTEARRTAFANDWVNRAEFAALYPATLTDAAYVDKLLQTAGVTLTTPDSATGATRDSLVADLRRGDKTRAEVARAVAESREVDAKEFNRAFVAMQYFGYLRRDPEPQGFQAWLNYLNANPSDFRTMVHGFIYSHEYQLRFGPPR